jgi:hypothetical protein
MEDRDKRKTVTNGREANKIEYQTEEKTNRRE